MPSVLAVLAALFTFLGVAALQGAKAAPVEPAYKYSFPALMGGEIKLSDYAGKVILVVNTASKCGYTGQYEGLEALWKSKKDQGLVIIGAPSGDFLGQELGSAAEIKQFCTLNYGVTFPMTAKIHVKGKNAHPFYQWAKRGFGAKGVPGWNFHKLLIGRDGMPAAAFGTRTPPDDPKFIAAIEAALAARPNSSN